MKIHVGNGATIALSVVLVFFCTTAPGLPVEYQIIPDMTSPTNQGWAYIGEMPQTKSEFLTKDFLQLESRNKTALGPIYLNKGISPDLTYYHPFEVRIVFKIVDCQVPSPDVPLMAVLVNNGSVKDYVSRGRSFVVGMSRVGGKTKIGFVNTDNVFFGTTHLSSNPGFIELVVKKDSGSTAPVKLIVDGKPTNVQVPPDSPAFELSGSAANQQLRFGFMHLRGCLGTIQVVGCTGAGDKTGVATCTAPAIRRPEAP
ncbi:MAG: hypothetical protein ACOX9C_02230 [Kiritimatiellia bacterium]